MAKDIAKRTEKKLEKEAKKEKRREQRHRLAKEAEGEMEAEKGRWGVQIAGWKIPEYETHQRSRVWYIAAAVVIVLLLIYCFVTVNLLFALIIIITSFIVIFQHSRKPETYDFSITKRGIAIEDSFYPYDTFDNFWIAYHPPDVKAIYFTFKSLVKPEISVYLGNQNPLRIREILLEYLDENLDREDETTSDALRRLLKI